MKDSEAQEQVYFYLGELQTGWFSVVTVDGDAEWCHTGTDGILHDVTTMTTATCTEYGYRMRHLAPVKSAGEPESVYQHQASASILKVQMG